MEEKLKKMNNEELLQLYRLVTEHKEYVETEKSKIEDDSVTEKNKVEDDSK